MIIKEIISNPKQIPRKETERKTVLRQATLRWPTGEQKEDAGMEEKSRPKQPEPWIWIEGGKEEDNERYRAFLQYCEERRQESRMQQEEDEGRKKRAKARKNTGNY